MPRTVADDITLISDSMGRGLYLPGIWLDVVGGMTLQRLRDRLHHDELLLSFKLIVLMVGTNDISKCLFFSSEMIVNCNLHDVKIIANFVSSYSVSQCNLPGWVFGKKIVRHKN